MTGRGLRLPFKLLGVPVYLDYSFLLILPLFAYLIGSQLGTYAQVLSLAGVSIDPSGLEQGATRWLLGAAASIGLFTSVLVHELGHAATARAYGVRTKEIRLWFLGGVAQLDDMPRGRGAEAVVAIAGPIVSFLIGALLWWLLPSALGSTGFALVVSYLAVTNVALAIFNLLPALPLDGGRVLRGVLELFMPHVRATAVAVFVSGTVAIMLGLFGFFSMNFLLVVMAFFIYNAGRAEAQAAVITTAVEGKAVRDVMTKDPITVDLGMPLEQFVRLANYQPHSGYPVVTAAAAGEVSFGDVANSRGALLGYARIADAQAQLALGAADESSGERMVDGVRVGGEPGIAPRTRTVAEILTPAETIGPDDSAMDALRRMAESSTGRLMVTDAAGRLVGVVGKSDVIRLLRERGR